MKNKFLKVMSLMMSMCILVSVSAGCSGQKAQKQEQTKESQNAKKAEPVKFSILLKAGPEFTPDNNAWVKEINEKANADITWTAVPIANIWEKRNVIMASNDYPEVIIMNTTSKGVTDNLYDSMVKNKIVLPVDDYIKNAPNIMKYTHKSAWEAVKNADGKIYMVPRCTIVREDFMAIRKDWREKLNLSVPKTTDDWSSFFKAIATKDPDGNGKADTYGVSDTNELMSSSSTVINMEYFARAWNADRNWYDNGKGEVEYGVFAKDGRFKYALDFYKKLISEKSLDQDIMTNKGIASVNEKFSRGVTSAHRIFAGQLDSQVIAIKPIQPSVQVELVDFPTAPESKNYAKEKLVFTNAGLYNAWALTNKAKGKEQSIINVFDWMLGDEGWSVLSNGVEGVHYKKDGDKIIRLEPEYTSFTKWIGNLQQFRRPNDESLWLKKQVPEMYQYQKEWLDKSVKYVTDNYVQKGLMGISSDKETNFYKKDTFTKKFVEVTAKIIYGELPLTAWDDYLKEVYSSGWDEVTKEYNDYYKAHK